MDNLPESIIRVFLTKQVLVLKDSNISHILHIQGIQCSEEEVRRHVQSLCPALFQISSHKDKTITIRVDPQVINIGCLSIIILINVFILMYRLIYVEHFFLVVVTIQ